MNEKQVLLVKHSWSYVAGELDDVSNIFFRKMMQLAPELKPQLKKLHQEKRLSGIMTTMNHLVASLPEFKKAEKEVLILLAEYADSGISKHNYDTALIAFLTTLEKKLGDKWNTEMRDSWISIFISIHQYFIRKLEMPSTLLTVTGTRETIL
jgi:hemoglobin-like flavoprotein